MNNDHVRKVLVEMDCLLDTRIATISLLNSEVAKNLLFPEYRKRPTDNFEKLTKGLISDEDFKNKYYDRDVETLKVSNPTGVLRLLHEISNVVGAQRVTQPDVDHLVVEINLHPYKLNKEEQEVLVNSVGSYLYPETEIRIVSIENKDLTPERIRDSWDCLIIYDFDYWFTAHAEGLNATPIPRNLMYAPALYIEEPSEDKFNRQNVDGVSLFSLLEMSLVANLNLEFLPVEVFSLLDP